MRGIAKTNVFPNLATTRLSKSQGKMDFGQKSTDLLWTLASQTREVRAVFPGRGAYLVLVDFCPRTELAIVMLNGWFGRSDTEGATATQLESLRFERGALHALTRMFTPQWPSISTHQRAKTAPPNHTKTRREMKTVCDQNKRARIALDPVKHAATKEKKRNQGNDGGKKSKERMGITRFFS